MLVRRLSLFAAGGAVALLAGGAAQASASDFVVGQTTASCPRMMYTSIQAAVTAAGRNDRVLVCDGTYPEQVRIQGSAKDGLTLAAVDRGGATIADPVIVQSPRAIVLVAGAQRVTVSGFTITGPYGPVCGNQSDPDAGVKVNGGGSASISYNHITAIQAAPQVPLGGCQDGYGIVIGSNPLRNGTVTPASANTPGSAEVTNNVVDTYQKNGIAIDGNGSSAKVRHNRVVGSPMSSIIARNGIQVSNGAAAEVKENEVSGNTYTGPGAATDTDTGLGGAASGISVFAVSGNVVIAGNSISGNDLGVELGVGTPPFPPNSGTTDVTVKGNVSNNNVLDGIRAFSDATDNRFAGNSASGNGVHDCHDDSVGSRSHGTANAWHGNHGASSYPNGICRPNPGGEEDSDN